MIKLNARSAQSHDARDRSESTYNVIIVFMDHPIGSALDPSQVQVGRPRVHPTPMQ